MGEPDSTEFWKWRSSEAGKAIEKLEGRCDLLDKGLSVLGKENILLKERQNGILKFLWLVASAVILAIVGAVMTVVLK